MTDGAPTAALDLRALLATLDRHAVDYKARQAVELIAATRDRKLARAKLRRRLGVSE